MMNNMGNNRRLGLILGAIACAFAIQASAQERLFETVGPPDSVALPAHVSQAQSVRINRRALQAPELTIDLFGEQFTAVRDRVERHKPGQLVWVGHLQGNPGNTVIVTVRGNAISGLVQNGAQSYRLGIDRSGQRRLYQIDLLSLPADDAADLPQGNPDPYSQESAEAMDAVTQDLMVVYNQAACDYKNGCPNLEADIVTAVADLNTAYAQSGIDVTMNLVKMAFTNYTGTGASQALSDLRGTTDGQMDEIHQLRDDFGADIVSLVYDGQGCGIGYLPSSASTAFNVTDIPCLVGNRTMAHEIGHNQGAHHDRVTVGGGSNGAYNYGYRRCNNGTAEDVGSPYFRTVLSYSCSGAPRVGRFSNPNFNYSAVPQGIDPAIDPTKGAWNARTINESAAYVAGFRTASTTTPPLAPSGLVAAASGYDAIGMSWLDNSDDESSFTVQRSLDNTNWSTIATLGANETTHEDTGLDADTLHYYRVRASNSAGASGFSNTTSATTDPLPSSVDDFAYSEILQTGTVAGLYSDTHDDDGVAQSITEKSSGGPKRRRKQSFTHTWLFDVLGGAGGVVLTANAWVSGSEGANFYYSDDGGANWTLMFAVDENADSTLKTFALPGSTSGEVRVQARDATQTNGEAVDTLEVDYLVMTSYSEAGDPPAAPDSLSITNTTSGSVSLSFVDHAENEFGFEVWRSSSDLGANCTSGTSVMTLGSSAGAGGTVTHTDTGLTPETPYWYSATAFNGGGDSDCALAAMASTTAGSSITLSASGYKVKGRQKVDLTWGGVVSDPVEIYRDTTKITTANDGFYTDNIDAKGGGTYVYKICEAGSSTECSETVTVIF